MRRNPSKLRVGQPVTDEYGNEGVIEEVPTSRGGHYWVRMNGRIVFLTRREIKRIPARQNPLWPFSKPKPKPRDTMPGVWPHYSDLSGGKGKSKKNPSPRLYKVAMSNFTVRTVPEGPGEILESTGRNYRLRTSSRRKPSASPYLPAGRWCVVHGSPGASEIIVKRSQ